MRHQLLSAVLALGATLCAQNVPTFSTGVFLVHVDAEVLGQDGRPLIGLTKDDFRVLDGGEEQTIAAVSAEEQPLDLVLLFDTSGSMHGQIMKVAAVAHAGLRELRSGDRVCVMSFSVKPRLVWPFSDDLDAVEQAIQRVAQFHFRGGTRIQDSVNDAATRFVRSNDREHQRRAVLILTDDFGRPARNKTSIVENFWEADALLSGLVVTNHVAQFLLGSRLPAARRRGGIEDLVEKTGGDIIYSDDISSSFPEMMHRIRSRYSLYYRLPEGQVGSLRTIDVQLSAQAKQRFPQTRVIARRAYRLQPRDRYGFTSR